MYSLIKLKRNYYGPILMGIRKENGSIVDNIDFYSGFNGEL
jgi:hypothetical protein